MQLEIIKGGFRNRKLPLSPDYRPMYKIGLLVLILNIACRGTKASLSKLHFLIWATKSEKNMAFVRWSFLRNDISKIVSWGVEPALNKALHYAVAEGLVVLISDRYSLTKKGVDFSKAIEKDRELFDREKTFLKYIGKQRITEDFINKLTEELIK